MFGTDGGARLLREASARSADEACKVAPRLWAQLYTVREVTQGYVVPGVCALRPDKTVETYHGMWRMAREAVWGSIARPGSLGN